MLMVPVNNNAILKDVWCLYQPSLIHTPPSCLPAEISDVTEDQATYQLPPPFYSAIHIEIVMTFSLL